MQNSTLTFKVAVLTFLFFLGCHSSAQSEGSVKDSPNELAISLLQYLQQLGDLCDCFFTIEESWTQGEPMNSLSSHLVPATLGSGDAQQELKKLTKLVPNLVFEVDAQNPAIIHVIDSRLAQLHSYSMDQTVHGIDFTGKVNDLLVEISRKGIKISPQTGFAVGDPLATRMDATTVVQVKQDHATVRALLSDSIPLKSYSRILWTASTERHTGAVTVVNFTGPRTVKDKP